MKKDVITIITLLILIVLLSGGIFFAIKNDMFSSKTNDSVLKNDGTSENDSVNDDNEEKKNEVEQNKDEENSTEEEPSKQEELKKEEKPVVAPPAINKVEVNRPSSVTSNNSSNNSNQNSGNNNGDQNSGNNVTDPEPVKPVLPNGGTLTCTLIDNDDEGVFTHTIVGVFDITDAYINSYKETFVYDFSDTYEPFDDEARNELEEGLKGEIVNSLGEFANVFTITPGSKGNIINVSLVSERNRLKASAPDAFTPTGNFYYENFKNLYVNLGYTCN